MKLKILVLSLFLSMHFSFAQKLILHGYVDRIFSSDTIYYSIDKMDFSTANFILLRNQKYTLELELLKIKKSKTLYFSNSLWNTETPEKKEDCVHAYNLKKILKIFKDKTADIDIENDVIASYRCGIWQVPPYDSDGSKFEGKYEFTINGQKRITLINAMLVQSEIVKRNDKLMTHESSNWSYNENEKTLGFSRVKQYNPELGLELMIDDSYVFDVIEKDGVLSFESKNGNIQLKKL